MSLEKYDDADCVRFRAWADQIDNYGNMPLVDAPTLRLIVSRLQDRNRLRVKAADLIKENDHLRKRLREIDDEAYEYAEEIEELKKKIR